MTKNELNAHNLPEGERLDVTIGGFIVGPGDELSDSIKSLAGVGQFIINAETVRILGRERLDKLVDLAEQFRVNCHLANGEYAVPASASLVLFDFWQKINLSGVISRADGWSEVKSEELRQIVDVDIAAIEQRVTGGS